MHKGNAAVSDVVKTTEPFKEKPRTKCGIMSYHKAPSYLR